MKNAQKYIIILILIILLGTGFIVWKINQNNESAVDKDTIGALSLEQMMDTKDWLLYTNKELGISFKYPKGVTITLPDYEPGVMLHFLNDQYQLIIVQPQGGLPGGYEISLRGYKDKVIVPNQEARFILGYANDANNDVMYFVSLAGDDNPDTTVWTAHSFIEKPLLNQSIVSIFDQISASFKTTK